MEPYRTRRSDQIGEAAREYTERDVEDALQRAEGAMKELAEASAGA